MPEMTEPQTLDEVIDAASVTEEAQPETPQTSQEVVEESYTRIDPKTLPPELQAMHKSLLRDYTKKTQSLAQQRKEFEALRSQPQPVTTPQESTLPDKPSENMSVDEYTAFMLAKVEEKLTAQQQKILDEQNQKYLDKAVQEFEATDERLNPESPEGVYDEYMRNAIGIKLDEELDAYTKENGSPIGFDYQGKTTELIEQYEEHMESRAKAIAETKTKQAFQGVRRTAPTSAKSSQAPSKPAGKMSLDEAIDNAFSN